MSRPVTQGGFSNDGSKIMQTKVSMVSSFAQILDLDSAAAQLYDIDAPNGVNTQVTISKTLFSSQLSLEQFYNVPQLVTFIQNKLQHHTSTTPFVIAIQCPDELLSDLVYLIKILQQKYDLMFPRVSFYTLGDTSYAACCVDFVSAKHISADMILHLGFACFSEQAQQQSNPFTAPHTCQSDCIVTKQQPQSSPIPVFYAFGVISLEASSSSPSSSSSSVLPVQPPVQEQITSLSQQSFPLLSLFLQLFATPLTFWNEDGSISEPIDFTPPDDDYTEYPDELMDISNEQYSLLLVPDQRFLPNLSTIMYILQQFHITIDLPYGLQEYYNSSLSIHDTNIARGIVHYIEQYFTNITQSSSSSSSSPSQHQIIAPNALFYHLEHIRLVLSYPTSQLDILSLTHSLPTTPDTNTTSLQFAGYTFPIHSQTFSSEILSTLSQRQLWHRFFNKSQWNVILLTKHNSNEHVIDSVHKDGSNNNDISAFFNSCTIPDPSSSSALIHWSMNFSQHFIYDCFPLTIDLFTSQFIDVLAQHVPSHVWIAQLAHSLQHHSNLAVSPNVPIVPTPEEQPVSINYQDEPFTMHLFSPSSGQSRVLSQRFYLVEKAKNTTTIGIVAGTGSSPYVLQVIERLKKLLTQNNVKYYVIAIGKINEAKLLNFGDISMFVVITCPLSVLFQFYNKQGQLKTNFSEQQHAYALANQTTSASVASMIDMITPFECELAFNTMEFYWNGSYTTHFADVIANTGRLGLNKDEITPDDLEYVAPITPTDVSTQNDGSLTKETTTPSRRDKSQQQLSELRAEEEETGVRYSSIDNKYHEIASKKAPLSSLADVNEHGEANSNAVVEQQTFGLIDPTTNKQLIYVRNLATGQVSVKERSFQGLAHDQQLSAENMEIQPGYHGTSEGYRRFGTTDEKR